MNSRRAFVLLVSVFQFALLPGANAAGRVNSFYFKTAAPPPATVFPAEWKAQETLFRVGLDSLPENVLVSQTLNIGGGALGLSSDEATNLNALLDTAYSRIKEDPQLANLPSALPYCYSAQRQTNGHYFVYCPDRPGPEPLLVVFLTVTAAIFSFTSGH